MALCAFAVMTLGTKTLEAASRAQPVRGNVLSVRGSELLYNGSPTKLIGVRCSAALISDATTQQLIDNLDTFRSYGLNSMSVYVMGSRFSDVKGYRPDATLDPIYAARLARILDAADERQMIVLVGCLYWSTSRAKEELEHWTQREANLAVANTVKWLAERNYRHVFVDPDNEGMATRATGWSFAELIDAGHAANPACLMAYNSKAPPPANVDVAIHFSPRIPGKPYVETEGTPTNANYWGTYSKRDGYYNYLNIGVYSEAMKANQLGKTVEFIEGANGYLFASTWLQAAPPLGPNMVPGGLGTREDPGVRWWLEFVREKFGKKLQ